MSNNIFTIPIYDETGGNNTSFQRRIIRTWKATVGPSVSFQTFQKCLKRLYMINYCFFFTISPQTTNVALEKALVSNIALLH